MKNKLKVRWKYHLLEKHGFTLVELLLVMAIIGILAGVIFVSLMSARERARMSNFKKTAKTINVAAALCIDSDGGSGELQNVASGGNICDIGTVVIPPWKQCSSSSDSTAQFRPTVGREGGDNYQFVMYCDSAETGCFMTCEAMGCTATDCD